MLTSISGHVMLTLLPIFTVTFVKFWKISYFTVSYVISAEENIGEFF